MAQFCTKCGSPMSEGMQFCTGCGSAVGAPAGAVAPAPMTPAAVAPVAAPVAMPAPGPKPSSGSPIVKIILIVLAVLILLGVLGAGACAYFVYRTKQRINQFSKQVSTTFPMPTGTREVHARPSGSEAAPTPEAGPTINPATLIYPGATAKEGASMSLGGFQVQQYTTDDPLDKVLGFYKEKLGPKAMVQESNNRAVVQLGSSNGLYSISIERDEASGKTQFSITRIGK